MSNRDLVTSEGVDAGSAASTTEGLDAPGSEPTGAAVVGPPPNGSADDVEQGAAPVSTDTEASRRGADERGPGQQLAAGEG